MRMSRLMLFAVFLLALPLMARETPTISSVSPNALHSNSGEWFVTLQGTHYLPLSEVVVIFNGPAGVLTLSPNAGTDTNMTVWLPLEVLNSPGYYTVMVRASHAQDSNTVNLRIIGSSIFLRIPDIVLAEAMSIDGGVANFEVTATSLYSPNTTVECSYKSGDIFKFDTTMVDCTATDDEGGGVKDSFPVIVGDHTPPSMLLPVDLTAFGKPDGSFVTFDIKTTDMVDPEVKATCKPESGSFFPIGTGDITCSSGDRYGNQSSQTFRVHVGDDETPALIVPLPVFAEATGRDGALVKYDVRAVTSKGEAADVRCDPPSGSQFIMGVTPVKCTAFGPNGKTISEIFNVTVADTTPPDLALPRGITEQAPSPEGAKVTFTAYGKDAIDGETLAACFPASGDLFAPGTTTVHCSSVDASKNEASGTFEVTVIPWFDPVEPEN